MQTFCIFEYKIQVFMGKGDRKTKRGKIIMGSFGVSRPHYKKQGTTVKDVPEKKVTAKDTAAKQPKEKKKAK